MAILCVTYSNTMVETMLLNYVRNDGAKTEKPCRPSSKMVRGSKRTIADIRRNMARLAKLQGRKPLIGSEKLCILRVYFALSEEKHERHVNDKDVEDFDVRKRTSKLLGRAESCVSKVLTAWNKAFASDSNDNNVLQNVVQANICGNRTLRKKRIPDNPELLYKVRDFVQHKRLEHERVTATEVLAFFIDEEICSVLKDSNGIPDSKDYKAALRSTQRYLSRNGFQRGKRNGAVRVKPSHIAWRNSYIRTIIENRAKEPHQRMQEVYSDESYIHHHHRVDHDNLFHPEDSPTGKMPHKGRRICFVAAIRGNGTSEIFELIPESVWSFCPINRQDHRGDYHKVFNAQNYLTWFCEQLLPNLHEPSLIIIDNASYHKSKPYSAPNASKMKKAQVLYELSLRGISYDTSTSAVEAKILLRKWVNDNIEPAIVEAATKFGHQIVFTPPHFSDLQPIELLWARIKGAVGRQYNKYTTLRDVSERLNTQFQVLDTEEGRSAVQAIINHVDTVIEKFQAEIAAEEEAERTETESQYSDESRENSSVHTVETE